jgi:hypothetical protein
MLLSTAYFPPAEYFALMARDMTLSADRVLPSVVHLEACENYQKQSYRNRCYILASDGPQMLQVPVVHGDDMSIRNILIDYSTPWVVRTERALATAYETSAFFEYYAPEVFALLESGEPRLWDFNLSLIRWCAAKAGIQCRMEPTTDFIVPDTVEDDFRYSIHPKRPMPEIPVRPWYQVFKEKAGGFTPGLSMLDLLFNEGPDSISFIRA